MYKMKIGGIIVTFNPDIQLLIKNIESIINQVDKLIIIDNNSNNFCCITNIDVLKQKKIKVIKNPENYGIAKALNIGFEYYKKNMYHWVLTLDQDSISPKNMVQVFSKYVCSNVGIICPNISYKGKSKIEYKTEYSLIKACMTSGSLTNVAAWEKCNGFDETLFIDYVDNDFCMRLILNNYNIVRVNKIVLEHTLGEYKNIKIPFLGSIVFYEHSPSRTYYMIRNNKYFIKKYKNHLNVFKEEIKVCYIIATILLFSSQKLNHIKEIRYGYLDYKSHKMGVKR